MNYNIHFYLGEKPEKLLETLYGSSSYIAEGQIADESVPLRVVDTLEKTIVLSYKDPQILKGNFLLCEPTKYLAAIEPHSTFAKMLEMEVNSVLVYQKRIRVQSRFKMDAINEIGSFFGNRDPRISVYATFGPLGREEFLLYAFSSTKTILNTTLTDPRSLGEIPAFNSETASV